MQSRTARVVASSVISVAFTFAFGGITSGQEPSQPAPQEQPDQQPNQQQEQTQQPNYIPQDRPAQEAQPAPDAASPDDATPAPAPERGRPADGRRRRDLPVNAYAVVPGTKFLVRLEKDLNTHDTRDKARFTVRTLEPLEAGSGIYLPSGAEIHGHVSRVESSAIVGRAKIWLTFDDVRTRFGNLPIIAEVVSVPGDPSVKTVPREEGLIEERTNGQQAAAEAAATAAALAAVKTLNTKDKKEIAQAAAMAAIAAYLEEIGRAHDLTLTRGAKLELELERPLYLLKDTSRL